MCLNRMPETSTKVEYLWATFRWLDSVAKSVICDAETVYRSRDIFRDNNTTDDNHSGSIEGDHDQDVCLISLRHSLMLETTLRDLEDQLFEERREKLPVIENVYAKESIGNSNQPAEVPNESWAPSGAVIRRAKEYIAEIIPFT